MSTTFDDLFDKAKNVADAATKMTGEVVEMSKAKLQAFKLNSNIQKTYEKLGSIVYDSIKFDTDSKELVDSCVAEIDDLMEQLDEIHATTAARSAGGSGIRCLSCGYENTGDAFFCARCGSPLDMSNEPTQYTTPTEVSTVESDEATGE